jgi:hypothetical protein
MNPDWKATRLKETLKTLEANPVGPNCSIRPLSNVLKVDE